MTLPRALKVGDVCRCRNGDVVYIFGNDGTETSSWRGLIPKKNDWNYVDDEDVEAILCEGVDLSCMGEQHPQSKNMKLCHQNGNFIYMDAYHPPKKTWKLIFTQPNFVHHIKDIEADSEAEAYEKLKASGAIRLEQKE